MKFCTGGDFIAPGYEPVGGSFESAAISVASDPVSVK